MRQHYQSGWFVPHGCHGNLEKVPGWLELRNDSAAPDSDLGAGFVSTPAWLSRRTICNHQPLGLNVLVCNIKESRS